MLGDGRRRRCRCRDVWKVQRNWHDAGCTALGVRLDDDTHDLRHVSRVGEDRFGALFDVQRACVVRQDRTASVQIPQGVSTGTRLRLSGQGEAAPYGGPAGDLYVEIRVLPDDRFIRDGDDLLYELELDIAQAALGSETTVPLIEGDETPLTVPPGTQPGQRFAITGKGLGRLGRRGRGNMNVIAKVVVPTKLSKEEERTLRGYAEMRGESVKSKRRFL